MQFALGLYFTRTIVSSARSDKFQLDCSKCLDYNKSVYHEIICTKSQKLCFLCRKRRSRCSRITLTSPLWASKDSNGKINLRCSGAIVKNAFNMQFVAHSVCRDCMMKLDGNNNFVR